MSLINVTNVVIGPQVGMFLETPFSVEIAFEALEPLKNPLIWKVVYVGEANTDEYDQMLEDIEMPINQAGSM